MAYNPNIQAHRVSGITASRIVVAGAGNILSGTTNLTFSGNALRVGGAAASKSLYEAISVGVNTDYDVFYGERYLPRITLNDTNAAVSFQFWNIGAELRVGTNGGSNTTAAMVMASGNSGNTYFNGQVNLGAGASFSAAYKVKVGGNILLSGATLTAPLSTTSTILSGGTDLSLLFAGAGTIGGQGTNVYTFSSNDSQDTTFTDYIFNGGLSSDLILVDLASGTNFKSNVFNVGSATLTLQSDSGGADIWEVGSAGVSSLAINPGEACLLIGDGTWIYAKLIL